MSLWNRIFNKRSQEQKEEIIYPDDMEIDENAVLRKYAGENAVITVPYGVKKSLREYLPKKILSGR